MENTEITTTITKVKKPASEAQMRASKKFYEKHKNTMPPLGALRHNNSFTDHPVTMNPNVGFPSKSWLCSNPIIRPHTHIISK